MVTASEVDSIWGELPTPESQGEPQEAYEAERESFSPADEFEVLSSAVRLLNKVEGFVFAQSSGGHVDEFISEIQSSADLLTALAETVHERRET